MTTVELQKMASSKLRISSEETMKIAEQLYQSGYISYPRTETSQWGDDTDFHSLIAEQSSDSNWGPYAQQLLSENKFRPPKKGRTNDNSHPPIHPTKHANDLTGKSKALYDFIVRHFLATCSDDAKGLETIVTIDISGEIFTATGLMVQESNWLDVFPWERWSDKNLPLFKLNEQFIPTNLLLEEGKTTPPELLNEKELISLMDKNGIGTDATIAQHIETILSRGYAEKVTAQRFAPTTLGLALVDAYISMGLELSKPKLRAEMESDMVKISKGQKSKESVVKFQLEKFKEIFIKITREAIKLDTALARYFHAAGTTFKSQRPDFSICGKCSNKMCLRTLENDNRLLFCETCNQSYMLPRNGDFEVMTHMCPICNFQVVNVKKEKENKRYTLCPFCRSNPPSEQVRDMTSASTNFNCFSCNFDCPLAGKRNDDPVKPCSICKKSHMVLRKKKENNGYFIGCKGYPNCSNAIWLPEGLLNATTLNSKCEKCRNCNKIHFVFKKQSMPPGYPTDFEGCVDCDSIIRELAEHSGPPKMNATVQKKPMTYTNPPTINLADSYNNLNSGLNKTKPPPPPPPSSYSTSSTYSTTTSSSYNINNNNNNAYDAFINEDEGSEDVPRCRGHNLPCVLRTVTKEGKNQGRQFYVCPKPQEEQLKECFMWADDFRNNTTTTSSYGGNSSYSSSSSYGSNNSGGGSGGTSGACYNCGQQGHWSSNCPQPKKGYSGKGSNTTSKYPSPAKGKYSKAIGKKKNYSPAKTKSEPKEKKARKCSACGQEGHTKLKCPNM